MIAVCLWGLTSMAGRASALETSLRVAERSAAAKVPAGQDEEQDSEQNDDASSDSADADGHDDCQDALLFSQTHAFSSPEVTILPFFHDSPRLIETLSRVPRPAERA
jgi:hypothetical protein